MSAYWDNVGQGDVTDRDMRFYMNFAAVKLGYSMRNIQLYRIETNSNREGGLWAMKLEIFDD